MIKTRFANLLAIKQEAYFLYIPSLCLNTYTVLKVSVLYLNFTFTMQ